MSDLKPKPGAAKPCELLLAVPEALIALSLEGQILSSNGLTLTRRLKGDRAPARFLIVALTAKSVRQV